MFENSGGLHGDVKKGRTPKPPEELSVSTLSRRISELRRRITDLATQGDPARQELDSLTAQLADLETIKNTRLHTSVSDTVSAAEVPVVAPNPVVESVVPDEVEDVTRRIGARSKKKMDLYSEAMKDMEDEYDRVEGAKLRAQEEEKIDESLDHLIDEYEREGVSVAKKANKRAATAASPESTSEENKDTGSDNIRQDQPKKGEPALAVDAVPVGDSNPGDIASPRAPEAAPVVDAQNASSAEQTAAAPAANVAPENGTPAVEPVEEISIKDAKSFKELYQAIGTTHGIAPGFSDFSGGLKNKDGRFGAQGFEDLIRRVRRGEIPIESIPKEYGIRDKVAELLPLDTSSPDESAVAPASPGGNITFEEMSAEARDARARQDSEKTAREAAVLAAGEAAKAARKQGENITFAEMHADALRAQAQIEAQAIAGPVAERSRSWWRRSPQVVRDAALLSVVAPHETLARNKNKLSGKTKAAIVLGSIGAGALTFWLLNKDFQDVQDTVRSLTQNPDNVPTGAAKVPVDNSLLQPPREVEQSWMDKFREWLRGGSAMNSDTATVGSEMVAPTAPEVAMGVFEHTVSKGDTVWSIMQHMLPEKFPASVFAKLGPEQVAYIVDGLKDNLERMTPQQLKEFGISSGNIGKIFPGDTINFSKLFENQTLLNDLLEKARSLTEVQIQNIARNIRLGRM